MTQFYIPYTHVDPQTRASAPPGTVWVDVGGSADAYWQALAQWWARGEDLAVIEHDVLCRPDVVAQFEQCPEPWCVFGYDNICHPGCQEAWRNMLGCTRFRKELMVALPNAVASIPHDQRDWHNLCDALAGDKVAGVDVEILRPGSLRAAGYTHHWHVPPVHHMSWEGHQR